MANPKPPAEQLEDLQSEMLLREANDELRREQMEKFWKAYAPYLVGAALTILVGIFGYVTLKQRAIEQAESAGDTYATAVQAIADGKPDVGRTSLSAIIKDGTAGYAALARLQTAGVDIKSGKTVEAVAALDAIAADTSTDALLRDAARIKAAAVRIDSADWTEMQNRLTSMLDPANPWRSTARELLGLAAFKAGRLSDAKQSFQELVSDPRTPPSLSQRAQVIMGQIVAAELQAKMPASQVQPIVPAVATKAPGAMAPATGPVPGTPTVTVPVPAVTPKKTP